MELKCTGIYIPRHIIVLSLLSSSSSPSTINTIQASFHSVKLVDQVGEFPEQNHGVPNQTDFMRR